MTVIRFPWWKLASTMGSAPRGASLDGWGSGVRVQRRAECNKSIVRFPWWKLASTMGSAPKGASLDGWGSGAMARFLRFCPLQEPCHGGGL